MCWKFLIFSFVLWVFPVKTFHQVSEEILNDGLLKGCDCNRPWGLEVKLNVFYIMIWPWDYGDQKMECDDLNEIPTPILLGIWILGT